MDCETLRASTKRIYREHPGAENHGKTAGKLTRIILLRRHSTPDVLHFAPTPGEYTEKIFWLQRKDVAYRNRRGHTNAKLGS